MWLTPSSSMAPAYDAAWDDGQCSAATSARQSAPPATTKTDGPTRTAAVTAPVGPAAVCVDGASPTSTTFTCPPSATTAVSVPSTSRGAARRSASATRIGGRPVTRLHVPSAKRHSASAPSAVPATAHVAFAQRIAFAVPALPASGSTVLFQPAASGPERHTTGTCPPPAPVPTCHPATTTPGPNPVAAVGNATSARVLCRGVPVEGRRTQSSPLGVHTATSSPASALSHEPTTAEPAGVSTASMRSPAPQPPKVLNACACSATPAAEPVHTLHRTLPCAPPRSPPMARIRVLSAAREYQDAVRP